MNTHSLHSRHEQLTGCLLLLLLVVTRSGITRSHFGTELHLPDASWAVFWMMGAFTINRWWPVLLMLVCVAIDYWATSYGVMAGGVSSYCFTPAYPFLIPAYGSLWLLGRWSGAGKISVASLARMASSLLVGVSACFVISNLGFYLSAGYFEEMPALLYAQTVSRYWLPYLLHAAIYVAVGFGIYYLFGLKRAANAPSQVN